MPVVRGKNIEVLYSAETIAARNQDNGRRYRSRAAQGSPGHLDPEGSFIFAARSDPRHACGRPCSGVEFITLSSLRTGPIKASKITKISTADVRDRDVLLIDDILESRPPPFVSPRTWLLSGGARNVTIAYCSTSG